MDEMDKVETVIALSLLVCTVVDKSAEAVDSTDDCAGSSLFMRWINGLQWSFLER